MFRTINITIVDTKEPDTKDTDTDDDDSPVWEKAPDWKQDAESWIVTFPSAKTKVSVAATPVTRVSVLPPIQNACALRQSHTDSWNQLLARHGVDTDARFEAFQFGNETSATKAQNLALEPGVWHPNQRANMDWLKSKMNDA